MRAASWRAIDTAAEPGGAVVPACDKAASGTGVASAERAGKSGPATGEGTELSGVGSGGGTGRTLGESGRVLGLPPGSGEVVELGRSGGGGGTRPDCGSGVDKSPRCGRGGGPPEGRDGSTLELAGRGGNVTGRGGSATCFGATAGAGSAAPPSLSFPVPRSSPMRAFCAESASIAQIVLLLLSGASNALPREVRH